jgi:sulfonate transport system substrate-binding protein
MSGKLSRRIVLFALLGAACSKPSDGASASGTSAEVPAASKTAAGEQVTVRIGYQKIGSPFLLKERAEGLIKALAAVNAKPEWIEFQAGPPILEAMRGGAVDVGLRR